MSRYLANRLFKIGFWLFVWGCGPLFAVIFLAILGLLSNPNPIGPGLLAFLTFWPSLICMALGAAQVRRESK